MKLKSKFICPLLGVMFFSISFYSQKGEVNFVDFNKQKGLYDVNDDFEFKRIWVYDNYSVGGFKNNIFDTKKKEEKVIVYIYGNIFNELRLKLENKDFVLQREGKFHKGKREFLSEDRASDTGFIGWYYDKKDKLKDTLYEIGFFRDSFFIEISHKGKKIKLYTFDDTNRENIYIDFNEKFFYKEKQEEIKMYKEFEKQREEKQNDWL